MNYYYHKKLGLDIPCFWKQIGELLIPAIITTITGSFIPRIFSYSSNIITLAAQILLYSLLYVIVIWSFGMNDAEKIYLPNPLRVSEVSYAKNNRYKKLLRLPCLL